jgi:multidrug transporter EmrE-like cation transporter
MVVGAFLVGLSALFTGVANLLMRAGLFQARPFNLSVRAVAGVARQPLFLLGVLVYAIAVILWLKVLRRQELITSYTVLVGLTFVIVNVGAAIWFHERISLVKLGGLCVIVSGIALVSGSTKNAERRAAQAGLTEHESPGIHEGSEEVSQATLEIVSDGWDKL